MGKWCPVNLVILFYKIRKIPADRDKASKVNQSFGSVVVYMSNSGTHDRMIVYEISAVVSNLQIAGIGLMYLRVKRHQVTNELLWILVINTSKLVQWKREYYSEWPVWPVIVGPDDTKAAKKIEVVRIRSDLVRINGSRSYVVSINISQQTLVL